MSLFSKYHHETKDADGVPLAWPGGPDGYPFRGDNPPLTTAKEYENLRPSGNFRCRLFHLADAQDAKDYNAVRDKCANGLFIALDRDRQWDDKAQNYRIYLEWLEMSYQAQPLSRGSHDAAARRTTNASPYDRLAGVHQGW